MPRASGPRRRPSSSRAQRAGLGVEAQGDLMAKLTEKMMGSAAYLHNACVLICPFEGDKCKCAKHRLNGIGR
eukprot:5084037-Prymnesium_polylepis.1